MLFAVLVIIFLIVCLLLCLLVLIQSDKGGGISGAIGGGLSQAHSLLGTQESAKILTRGTTIFASAYMVLCIILSLVFSRGGGEVPSQSVLKKRAESQAYSPSSILQGGSLPTPPEATNKDQGALNNNTQGVLPPAPLPGTPEEKK